MLVPKCSSHFNLHILSSKGFTKRNVNIGWSLNSMTPADATLTNSLQTLFTTFNDFKYIEMDNTLVESL